jgi:copper homeostasis protein
MPNTSSKYVLEIACFNLQSCLIAQQAGADRVEFCSDYSVGGITPTSSDIIEIRKLVHIPLHIIIRPRAGNFVYDNEEIEMMKNTILFCKQHDIDGVVFGILKSDNSININSNKELVELAKPMSVTFHRAIDECIDIETAFNEIIELGFDKVLTSGGEKNALQGIETLKKCQEKFEEKITIIPGGGIRSNNIEFIIKESNCKQFHSAALTDSIDITDMLEVKKLKEYLPLF